MPPHATRTASSMNPSANKVVCLMRVSISLPLGQYSPRGQEERGDGAVVTHESWSRNGHIMVTNCQGLAGTWSNVPILPTADLGTVRHSQGASGTGQNGYYTIPKPRAPVRVRAGVPPFYTAVIRRPWVIARDALLRPNDCFGHGMVTNFQRPHLPARRQSSEQPLLPVPASPCLWGQYSLGVKSRGG